MRRFFQPALLIFTALLALTYSYAAWRLAEGLLGHLLLALPFVLMWIIPAFFWFASHSERGGGSRALHFLAYTSMGYVSFLLVTLLSLDLIRGLTFIFGLQSIYQFLSNELAHLTFAISALCLLLGMIRALKGAKLIEVGIPVRDLDPALSGFRIAQISDLHIGPTISSHYVRQVVEQTNALEADVIVLTGDIVDGPHARLQATAQLLRGLKARYGVVYILGNHDCYVDGPTWLHEFETMGFHVLMNSHMRIEHQGGSILLAGVVDPAAQMLRADLKPDAKAARGDVDASESAFRILLAHNPKLAKAASDAGFHLQISGHTHAGQFIPWTFITRLVHAPHYAGLSVEDKMWVYVSAGTGTWGPPIRLGTNPELSVLRLYRPD